MVMTTMGSEYWPKAPAGRVLCWLLAVYAFAIFGYITATIASNFVGRDRQAKGRKRPSGRPPTKAPCARKSPPCGPSWRRSARGARPTRRFTRPPMRPA